MSGAPVVGQPAPFGQTGIAIPLALLLVDDPAPIAVRNVAASGHGLEPSARKAPPHACAFAPPAHTIAARSAEAPQPARQIVMPFVLQNTAEV